MLRMIFGVFGSGANPAPASAPVKPFDERLKAIGYNLDLLPSYFLCPVSLHLMNTPMMINGDKRHTFDQTTLTEWRKSNNTCPLTRRAIETITPNSELATQIDSFITSLEKIHRLEQEIENTRAIDMSSLDALLQGTEIDNQEKLQELKEAQEEEIKRTRAALKLSLAHELQFFIAHTITIIEYEDKEDIEKRGEIHRITRSHFVRFLTLRQELRFWYPEFYEKTRGPDANDAMSAIYNFFPRNRADDPRFRGLIQGLLIGAYPYQPHYLMFMGLVPLRLTGPQAAAAAAESAMQPVDIEEQNINQNESSERLSRKSQ